MLKICTLRKRIKMAGKQGPSILRSALRDYGGWVAHSVTSNAWSVFIVWGWRTQIKPYCCIKGRLVLGYAPSFNWQRHYGYERRIWCNNGVNLSGEHQEFWCRNFETIVRKCFTPLGGPTFFHNYVKKSRLFFSDMKISRNTPSSSLPFLRKS